MRYSNKNLKHVKFYSHCVDSLSVTDAGLQYLGLTSLNLLSSCSCRCVTVPGVYILIILSALGILLRKLDSERSSVGGHKSQVLAQREDGLFTFLILESRKNAFFFKIMIHLSLFKKIKLGKDGTKLLKCLMWVKVKS